MYIFPITPGLDCNLHSYNPYTQQEWQARIKEFEQSLQPLETAAANSFRRQVSPKPTCACETAKSPKMRRLRCHFSIGNVPYLATTPFYHILLYCCSAVLFRSNILIMNRTAWLLIFTTEQANWRNGGQTATATERVPQVGPVIMLGVCVGGSHSFLC